MDTKMANNFYDIPPAGFVLVSQGAGRGVKNDIEREKNMLINRQKP